jgi:hypothetical protein
MSATPPGPALEPLEPLEPPQQTDAGFIQTMKFLYKNRLFDQIVSDILWSVIIIFVYLCANVYLKVRTNATNIRTNWPVYRCKPAYMPFAGMIMQPTDQSNLEYVQTNFEYCIQAIIKDMSSVALEPLYYTQSAVGSMLDGIANVLNDVRGLINAIRTAISSIIAEIMGRVLNIMQPIVIMLIKLRDMLNKVMGMMTTYLYTMYGMYDTMQSGLKSTFEIIVIILIAAGAALIAVWIGLAIAIAFGPFGIIPAGILAATGAVLTAIYIGIAIPMGMIAHALAEILHIHGLSLVPSPPSR